MTRDPYSVIYSIPIRVPVSTRKTISYTGISTKEIHCECGNHIKYEDIELNCDFPAYGILTCRGCGHGHRIIMDGTLGNLTGAILS